MKRYLVYILLFIGLAAIAFFIWKKNSGNPSKAALTNMSEEELIAMVILKIKENPEEMAMVRANAEKYGRTIDEQLIDTARWKLAHETLEHIFPQ